jgi:diguanylate cyclase (GGDEF)-like protein
MEIAIIGSHVFFDAGENDLCCHTQRLSHETGYIKSSVGVVLDIDHFKNINDTYGHKIGDDVLAMVANLISLSLRKMDVAARWGGEEFVVVLPGATKVVAKAVSERIRMLIGESFVSVGEDKLGVTVSIGVTISRTDDSVETVVSRADRLMYQSKSNGRNRVTEDE